MATITLPKTKYEELRQIKKKYEIIRQLLGEDLFEEPSTKNVGVIVREFKKTGRYSEAFLKSLKRGLKESSYFTRR